MEATKKRHVKSTCEVSSGARPGACLDHKTVFLAGATGMVGRAVLQHLLDHYPATAVRGGYFKIRPFLMDDRIAYVEGDLTNGADCLRMAEGADCAIMAACLTAGAGAVTAEPWRYVNDNLIMNARMLEAFHRAGVKRVVFIGSATLYQDSDKALREDDLDLAVDPHPAYLGFGWVVRYIEKLCRFWHDKYGMDITVVRAANIYGPYGTFHPDRSNFIPALIRKAVNHDDPFDVWGPPQVTRDVLYADDLARGVVRLLARAGQSFEIFNMGSGRSITVGQAAEWALAAAGHRPSKVNFRKDKPSTLAFRLLDSTKIRSAVGWTPDVSAEEGIRRTTEWWIQHKDTWTK